MSDFPQHDHLAMVKAASQVCGEFLEWLIGDDGPGLTLCEHTPPEQIDPGVGIVEYAPMCPSAESLLSEFFNIDLHALENEKQRMLTLQREANGDADKKPADPAQVQREGDGA